MARDIHIIAQAAGLDEQHADKMTVAGATGLFAFDVLQWHSLYNQNWKLSLAFGAAALVSTGAIMYYQKKAYRVHTDPQYVPSEASISKVVEHIATVNQRELGYE